jgi:CHAT domain-containing protein
VHVASHFQFQPGDQSRSFLLTGDGKHLSLEELNALPNLFRGVDLLTLSACNTGIGDNAGDGREVESFGVLAQNKGARAVIATLWPVADSSTSMLMREFYRTRQENPGILKAEALRHAQLKLLRGELQPSGPSSADRGVRPLSDPVTRPPGYTHPYFWAPFFLMGNWL